MLSSDTSPLYPLLLLTLLPAAGHHSCYNSELLWEKMQCTGGFAEMRLLCCKRLTVLGRSRSYSIKIKTCHFSRQGEERKNWAAYNYLKLKGIVKPANTPENASCSYVLIKTRDTWVKFIGYCRLFSYLAGLNSALFWHCVCTYRNCMLLEKFMFTSG